MLRIFEDYYIHAFLYKNRPNPSSLELFLHFLLFFLLFFQISIVLLAKSQPAILINTILIKKKFFKTAGNSHHVLLLREFSSNIYAFNQSDCVTTGDFIPEVTKHLWLRVRMFISDVFKSVNVETNKLSHIFCVDFGKKSPWFIESALASSGTSDKPRGLYSRSPLKICDLVDKIPR